MPYSFPQSLDRTTAFRTVSHLIPGAILLAGAAGFINSVVLGFFHTPVSHMTGAISHLGTDMAAGRPADIITSFGIIVGFFVGAVLAGVLVGAKKLIPGRRYGVALICEGLLLAAATVFFVHNRKGGLLLVALACGLQNATTSSYCGLIIRTTHVTGTFTDIAVMLGHWLRHRSVDWFKFRFLISLFLAFGIGGLIGAVLDEKYGPKCLVIAAVGFLVGGSIFFTIASRAAVRRQADPSTS